MIEEFTKAWFEKNQILRQRFEKKYPDSYKEIVETVVTDVLSSEDYYDRDPDPKRIHEIDDGHYQGTLVYVIGATGYQPEKYWYCKVGYGSCSGCDTLENIVGYASAEEDSEDERKKKVDELMTLALHIVQNMRLMNEGEL